MEMNRIYTVELNGYKVASNGYITGVEVKLLPYQVGPWLDWVRTRDKVFSSEENRGTTLVGVCCDRAKVIAIYRVCEDWYAFVADRIWYKSKKFRSALLADDLIPYNENAERRFSGIKTQQERIYRL
jgi:hypothetical protein